jgi:hypothetical protein
MEALMLCYRDEPLRDFPLGTTPVEVGRAASCDIVVHDEGIAERHALLVARKNEVLVYDLRATGRPNVGARRWGAAAARSARAAPSPRGADASASERDAHGSARRKCR